MAWVVAACQLAFGAAFSRHRALLRACRQHHASLPAEDLNVVVLPA